MKIIIDANVLFSALIRDSYTRRLILEYDGLFLFPEYIFEKFEKYKSYLVKKSKLNEMEFEALLKLILRKVVIVPNDTLEPFRNRAHEIVKI